MHHDEISDFETDSKVIESQVIHHCVHDGFVVQSGTLKIDLRDLSCLRQLTEQTDALREV